MRLSSLATVGAHRLHGAADQAAGHAARLLRGTVQAAARLGGHLVIPGLAWPPVDAGTSPYDGLYGRGAVHGPGPSVDGPGDMPLDAAVPLAGAAQWIRALVDGGGTADRTASGSPGAGTIPAVGVDTRAFAPRPPSPRFRRWVPVDERAPLVGILAGGTAAGFEWPALRDLLRRWPAPGDQGPWPVVLVAPGEAGRLHRALGAGAGVVRPVLATDPGSARRPVLLNALAGLITASGASTSAARTPEPATHGARGGTDWIHEAEASGVPVVTVDPAQPDPLTGPLAALAPGEAWDEASRATRLRAVGRSVDQQLATGAAAVLPAPASPAVHVVHEPRRVVVAGHDLKFAVPLVEHLRAAGHEVRLDRWGGHQRHDPARSRALAAWADAILCEWTLGNALWYSHHTPRATRLTTRLHLQEASLGFPGRVRQSAMDRFIFVADHIRRQVVRDHGIEFARTTVIPNAVSMPAEPPAGPEDESSAARRFTLGLVGIVPARKGLHRALDLVARLRAQDPRFTLRIKGRLPSDLSWMAERTSEAPYYRGQFERISRDPLLRDAVHFDDFGPDMDDWYRRVGVALSTSDFESFHFTLPDGAVRGAVPVSLAWPGADQLYPLEWLHPSVEAMATRIREVAAEPGRWHHAGGRAAALVAERYDARLVLPRLAREVLGG